MKGWSMSVISFSSFYLFLLFLKIHFKIINQNMLLDWVKLKGSRSNMPNTIFSEEKVREKVRRKDLFCL